MSWAGYTALVLVAVVVGLIIYDAVSYALGGNQDTISVVCLTMADRYRGFTTIVAFAVGVLFGHLFLPQHTNR
jgi:hypothetical protein